MTRARELAELAASYDSGNLFGMKNRIINGAMVIDQRNAGASVNAADAFTLDRWLAGSNPSAKYTVQRSSTAPSGFINSLFCTSSSAYSAGSADYFFLRQIIEGLNITDLAWGTASASAITLSFWVRSSITGTYAMSLQNSAQDRSYVSTYTINSANTWEQKTITIPGDTSGTWLTTNGTGIRLHFDLGSGSNWNTTANAWQATAAFRTSGSANWIGTNGATFYITGVQLEKGSTATSFDYRPYGTELMLCQRYYYKVNSEGAGSDYAVGWVNSTTLARVTLFFPASMRIAPTALEQSGTAGDYSVRTSGNTNTTCSAVPVFWASSKNSATTDLTVTSGLTAGQGANLRPVNTSAYLAWSAEL